VIDFGEVQLDVHHGREWKLPSDRVFRYALPSPLGRKFCHLDVSSRRWRTPCSYSAIVRWLRMMLPADNVLPTLAGRCET
jgi:hypothetical protein